MNPKKILGVVVSKNSLTFAMVTVDKDGPVLCDVPEEVIKFPAAEDSPEHLRNVRDRASVFIKNTGPDEIRILKAGSNPKGNVSPVRIKTEAAVEIAAIDSDTNVALVAPQTLAADMKRADKRGDPAIESRLGRKLSSEDKRTAAWLASMEIKNK